MYTMPGNGNVINIASYSIIYLNNTNVPNKHVNVIYLFMYEWKENEFQSKLFKCNSNA